MKLEAKRSVAIFTILGLVLLAAVWLEFSNRAKKVRVTFAGYTAEPTGRYTFAAFQLTNQTKHPVICTQGSLEVKSPQGWQQNNDHAGYVHGSILEPGKDMRITLLAPTSNEGLLGWVLLGRWRFGFSLRNFKLAFGCALALVMDAALYFGFCHAVEIA